MIYLSSKEYAKKWNLSERTIRNYCANNKIPNSYKKGKTWYIPSNAIKPLRSNKNQESSNNLLNVLRIEKKQGIKNGIYHKVQIKFTYNSNHIEGSQLTEEETRYIYETNTIGFTNNKAINIDDIIEAINHFRCIDYVINNATKELNESFIKKLHKILKTNTKDANKTRFVIGNYKKLPNEIGDQKTCLPEDVSKKMKELLSSYNQSKFKTINEIIDFHYQFESIHPFQDGNGRIGRLIMFKECLRNNIVPFIIENDIKWYYYRGLHEYDKQKGYLIDTCLSMQDRFKTYLD